MIMRFHYILQKLLGKWLDKPTIPQGRTVGYSLTRSEKANTVLGKHTKVYPPFFLHNVQLGDYSYIAKNSNISNCTIGKFCSIGPNVCCGLGMHPTNGISTSPMFYSTAKQNGVCLCKTSKFEESKITIIGNDVFIGANVTILDGLIIGDGAIIGAGAVVTSNVPPYAIAVGIPAVIRKYRFDSETIKKLLAKKWWEKGEDELNKVEEFFYDLDKYLD